MRTFAICGLLLVGLGGVLAVGQGAPQGPATMVVMPPTPLLPEKVWSLNATKSDHGDTGSVSYWYADCAPLPGAMSEGGAERCGPVMKEDALRRWATASYAGGGAKADVFALEFEDATDAFSAYTFYRSTMHAVRVSGAEARLKKAGNETSQDADGTLVWAGTAVMRIKGQVSTEELISLTAGLPKESGRRGLAPLLPSFIPGPGLDAGSVKYAVGPAGYAAMGGVLPAEILGWDKSAEVATASYKGKGTLTLLLYPTPQIAGDRGRAIQDAINKAGTAKFGTVAMRRVGPLVAVTTGGWTEAQAKALVGSVHLNEEVTFDQKMPLEFHAEVRKTASLLENIAIFSGILILAAILLGLFLGGARAGIRRLQGKPAYVEPEFLTISLRESETEHFEKIHSENSEG